MTFKTYKAFECNISDTALFIQFNYYKVSSLDMHSLQLKRKVDIKTEMAHETDLGQGKLYTITQ